MQQLWTFKSKGTSSAFGGNEGYPDEPQSHYVYDTTVKNYDKVSVGDLVIIASKEVIIGMSSIEEIKKESDVPKVRFRCPVCNTQEISTRKKLLPKYKCRKKHEFDTPKVENHLVNRFTAYYKSSFETISGLNTKVLQPYFINYNRYYSIQSTAFSFITDKLNKISPKFIFEVIQLQKAIKWGIGELPSTHYSPTDDDKRRQRSSLRFIREGQVKFRIDLFKIYGIYCMLTGCTVEKAIEASHINPYKGEKDNHSENGLLLRKDLHALFDSNLLGIEPDSLTVHLHPSIKNSYYKELNGKSLIQKRKGFGPSGAALKARWILFNKSFNN